MKSLSSSHLVIVAAITVLVTDAQVTLTTSQSSFICGEQQILTCIIEPYSGTMTWKKENESLASCSPLSCDVNPSMSSSYNFTFETGNGIFHMEILTVKVAENGKTFFCDNGVMSANVTSTVTVKNNYSVVKDNKKIDSNTTEITVTTGCIQDTADVKIGWYFQEVSNTISEKIKPNELASVTYRDNSVCIADPDCGVSGYSYLINSVNITDEGIGKNYSLGVDVTFDGITNTVLFDLFFIMNFPVSETPNCNTDCDIEIAIPYVVIFVIVIPMCIFMVIQYSKPKRKAKLKSQLAALASEESSVEAKLKSQLAALASEESSVEAERNMLVNQLAGLKTCISEVHHNNQVWETTCGFEESHPEAERIKIERERAAEKESHLKAEHMNLERQLEALTHSKAKRIELEREIAFLEGPRLEAKLIGIALLCSLPFIGLFAKGALVLKRRKPGRLQSWKVLCLVLVFVMLSMIGESFIILLWTVWSICQWYTLILALWDLICRLILCIIIAVLYFLDKDETNHIAENPVLSNGIIACILEQLKRRSTSPEP